MVVLPPGRFSITTGWPHDAVISWPMMRASRSVGPPAGNGTTIWMVRFG
jgi:hypothetical protein